MKLIYQALCFQMNSRLRVAALAVLSMCGSVLPASQALADEVMVAVASNFIKPMQTIAKDFEAQTGHEVKVSYGSSGKLLAQISHGAPFDLFLSADTDKVTRLIKSDLAVSGTEFVYAQGRLVLWSNTTGLIDGDSEILKHGDFKYIALADPKLAPYGEAARETLETLALYKQLKPRFVQGENISQTYQFVQTGNAQLGFVALSQVTNPDGSEQGSGWLVPTALHQPINQSAVLLKRGQDNPAATALLAFLRKNQTQVIIQSFGYDTTAPISPKAYAFAR